MRQAGIDTIYRGNRSRTGTATGSNNRTHRTVARSPRVCPQCRIVWEDWRSNTIRKQERSHGAWVWRELKDFPTIGCTPQLCPECGDNPAGAIKVASGVS